MKITKKQVQLFGGLLGAGTYSLFQFEGFGWQFFVGAILMGIVGYFLFGYGYQQMK